MRVGVFTAATLVFVVLKLAGEIAWPWIWVLSPLWIGLLWLLLVFLVVVFGTGDGWR